MCSFVCMNINEYAVCMHRIVLLEGCVCCAKVNVCLSPQRPLFAFRFSFLSMPFHSFRYIYRYPKIVRTHGRHGKMLLLPALLLFVKIPIVRHICLAWKCDDSFQIFTLATNEMPSSQNNVGWPKVITIRTARCSFPTTLHNRRLLKLLFISIWYRFQSNWLWGSLTWHFGFGFGSGGKV